MKTIKRNKSCCLPDRWQQIGRYCLRWASKIRSLVACQSIWGAWLQNAPCTNTLPSQTEASWVQFQRGFCWNGPYLARYTACFMSCSAFLNSRFTTQAWQGKGSREQLSTHSSAPRHCHTYSWFQFQNILVVIKGLFGYLGKGAQH